MTPFERYQAFVKTYPEAKETFKTMQAWYVANKPKNGIFVPSGNLYTMSPMLMKLVASKSKLAQSFTTMTDNDRLHLNYFWGLSLFGTWRYTLGVYQINDNLFDTLVKSPIPDDTPTTIFDKLPEWCVYIAFPEGKAINIKFNNGFADYEAFIFGFWVKLDTQNLTTSEGEQKIRIINFHLNLQTGIDNVFSHLQPLQLMIADDLSIKEAMQKHAKMVFEAYTPNHDFIVTQQNAKQDYDLTNKLLSLLLMLCAEAPDISKITGEPITKIELGKPKYTVNKRTGVFIPPQAPFLYEIGRRLGGDIKTTNDQLKNAGQGSGKGRRPHIRNAHYHGYWIGTGQNKQFKLNWIAPIFVNG